MMMACEGEARVPRFVINQFSADVFTRYLGQVLEFERPVAAGGSGSPAARMQLIEVTRHRMQTGLQREPFALLFAMRDQPPLSLGLHRLAHKDFEPCDLFIQRVSAPKHQQADPTRMYYEAVFS